MNKSEEKVRCWGDKDPLMREYHDNEWGVPVHDDRTHFEFILLEGVQAGLSWSTVLKRRENYREAFDNFDYEKVAKYDPSDIEELLKNPGLIRNRRKIESHINNARAFLDVRDVYASFDEYIWGFVNHKPEMNSFTSFKEMPTSTEISEIMAKDLKKKGFSFVGPTICYAYMQTVGMVNDHLTHCFRWKEIKEKYGS
ncbi:DNA-3-methyladenine glycosylase I [Candidatus Bathyarchaeota archaeon]|nr:DNA-3-methyladenine glycosylase I [Candidatus Bathyarchaeota archaeon]